MEYLIIFILVLIIISIVFRYKFFKVEDQECDDREISTVGNDKFLNSMEEEKITSSKVEESSLKPVDVQKDKFVPKDIKCSDEDRKIMMTYAPALYAKLSEFNNEIQTRGYEISLRNTEHYYESFRWHLWTNNNDYYSEEYKKINNQIEELCSSVCCICGSNYHLSLEKYYDSDSSKIFHTKCPFCLAKGMVSHVKKFLKYAEINTLLRNDNKYESLPRIYVRLIDNAGNILYDYSDNIYLEENKLYLLKRLSQKVEVRYAGIYLGVNDENGKPLFEGDLVVAKSKDNNRFYWGMAYLYETGCWGPPPFHVLLWHGFNNFSSQLIGYNEKIQEGGDNYGAFNIREIAGTFQIVGNVIEGNEEEISTEELIKSCNFLNRYSTHYIGNMNRLYENCYEKYYEKIFKYYDYNILNSLERFIHAQEGDYEVVLEKIKKGRGGCRAHWFPYTFPQVRGLGEELNYDRFYSINCFNLYNQDSCIAYPKKIYENMSVGISITLWYYGINSVEEAKTYIEHPILGERLREVTLALLNLERKSILDIFDYTSAMILHSSMTLFYAVSEDDLFQKVLDKYYNGQPDEKTLLMLK